MPSPNWVKAAVALSALSLCGGCEKVDSTEGLLNPPPRLRGTGPSSDATPGPELPQHLSTPAPKAIQTSAEGEAPLPDVEGILPILSRITLRDPSRVGDLRGFTLLTPLPRLSPQRAILRTSKGEDILLQLGDQIGDGATRISAITETSITLTSLEFGPLGEVSTREIEMKGTQPMPSPLPVAPPEVEVNVEEPGEEAPPVKAKAPATPTPTQKRLINWEDHSDSN